MVIMQWCVTVSCMGTDTMDVPALQRLTRLVRHYLALNLPSCMGSKSWQELRTKVPQLMVRNLLALDDCRCSCAAWGCACSTSQRLRQPQPSIGMICPPSTPTTLPHTAFMST